MKRKETLRNDDQPRILPLGPNARLAAGHGSRQLRAIGDARNLDISLRARFDRGRIESATFGGASVCKVIGVLLAGECRGVLHLLHKINALEPGWLIVIVGHSDTTGDAEQNLQLSYARARAVRDWMQRMGDIPDNCFAVQGAAGTQPIVSNDTASGRAINRRVDIRLVLQAGVCGAPSVEVGGTAR